MVMKQYNIIDYLRPTLFMKTTKYLLNYLSFFMWTCLVVGFYLAIFVAPTDEQQGETYRILYIHVPFAWVSLLLYAILVICCIMYLISRNPLLFFLSKNISSFGMVFTALTLCTGSLWGYPMWGTFWVWDARLTSVFLLFLVYMSHIFLCFYIEVGEEIKAKISSFFAIIGGILLPIIKYSVEWWNTLHQGSSISQMNISVDATMLYPLFIIFFGLIFYSLISILIMTRYDITSRKMLYLK